MIWTMKEHNRTSFKLNYKYFSLSLSYFLFWFLKYLLEQISHQWYEIEQWCLNSEWKYRNELQSTEHIIHSNRKWIELIHHTLLCTTISHEVIFLITSLEFILHSLLYSSAVISIVGECMFTHSIFGTTLSLSKQLLCTKLS